MSSERGTEPRPTRRRGLDRIAFRMAGPALLIVVIVAIGNTLVLLNTGTATDRHDHSREMSQLRMIVGDAALLAKAAANDERGFLLFADPQFIEGFQADRIDPLNELVDEIVDQASDETSGLAASYRDQVHQWITLVEEEFALRLDDREASEQFHAEVVRPARKIYEGTGNELVAAIDLDLADSDTSFNTALASTETAAAAALVVSTLAAFLGAAWLTRSTGRPIRALAAQADRLAAGEITVEPVTVRRGDEIGVLARTMNRMLERLERSDRQRRQFVSDASHELRTPLAVLRSEAEVARRAPDTTTVAEFGRVVIGETGRLEALVEDLLSLARADERKLAGARTAAPIEVDVDDVVLAEAERTRRLPIDRSEVSAGRVIGRSDDLARAVGHLLDNAARHGEHRVAVGVRTEDGPAGTSDGAVVRIWVDDDGSGIPEEDRRHIFDRFHRLDEARTRDRGGSGLGLAVVAETAAAMGGTAEIGTSPLGGARFELTLPAAAE